MRLRVVSLPATTSVTKNMLISSCVSRSPSISALTSAVMMSSRPLLAAVGRDRLAVRVDLGGGDLAVFLGRAEVLVLEADEPVAPVEDQMAVVVGDADHLADHLQRQLRGDLLDELDLVASLDAGDDGRARAPGCWSTSRSIMRGVNPALTSRR